MTSYYAPNAITFPQLRVNAGKVEEIARLERLDESLLTWIRNKIR